MIYRSYHNKMRTVMFFRGRFAQGDRVGLNHWWGVFILIGGGLAVVGRHADGVAGEGLTPDVALRARIGSVGMIGLAEVRRRVFVFSGGDRSHDRRDAHVIGRRCFAPYIALRTRERRRGRGSF